jgi:FSR family fosmidomycin resistance protein-like MFS transporter
MSTIKKHQNSLKAEGKEHKSKIKELWLITVGHGFTHWYQATIFVLLPFIGMELGLNYSEIGFIITFQFIINTITNICGGMLVDMIERKGLLMAISLFFVGFPYFPMYFIESYWLIIVCVTFVGVGNNFWHPIAIPTLVNRFQHRSGLALSIHGMGANLGDALSPLAVGSLLAILSWREVVMINMLPGLIITLIVLFMFQNLKGTIKKTKDQAQHHTSPVREYFSRFPELYRNKSMLLITIIAGFRSMTQNGLYTFLPLYLAYQLGYSQFFVGFGLFLLHMGSFVVTPIFGHLSDKVGRKKIVITSMVMTALVLLIIPSIGTNILSLIFIAILGFFLYAIRPVIQAWLMDTTPKKMAGTSVGFLFGIQSLGSSISPLLGGMIADKYGLVFAFYFLAVLITIAKILAFLIPREREKNMNDTVPNYKSI